jgi:hypothetical protein
VDGYRTLTDRGETRVKTHSLAIDKDYMYLKRDGVRSVLLGGLEKLCGAGWSCTSQAWYVLLTTRGFWWECDRLTGGLLVELIIGTIDDGIMGMEVCRVSDPACLCDACFR